MHTGKICLSYIIYYELIFMLGVNELNMLHVRALKEYLNLYSSTKLHNDKIRLYNIH